MKEVLKTIFKLILTIIILIGLIVIFQITFNYLQRTFIGNDNYYMIASEYTSIYGIISSLIITFLIFLKLFKKESEKYIPYIFNKKVFPLIIIVLVSGYLFSLFKMDVVYDEVIKSYSLFNLKGEEYKLEEIDTVDIRIKKHINQTYDLYYTLKIKNKKIEIFNHATDFGLELRKFDHISIFNNELKNMNIKMEKDGKYLDEFLNTLETEEKEKIESLYF